AARAHLRNRDNKNNLIQDVTHEERFEEDRNQSTSPDKGKVNEDRLRNKLRIEKKGREGRRRERRRR
ncbi:MAG: hypothetical protein ALECFALPRED_007700, partial [Alectoria fallacina]